MAQRRAKVTSKAGKEKVGKVLGEFKEGQLRLESGEKVTSRKQAIAIALSEARKRQTTDSNN